MHSRATWARGNRRREERCSPQANDIRGGNHQDPVGAFDDVSVNRRRNGCVSAARGDVDKDEVGTRAKPFQQVLYECSCD
jgi:hypothetical protein